MSARTPDATGFSALARSLAVLGRDLVVVNQQDRIGHLAAEPDVSLLRLGEGNGSRPPVFVLDPDALANPDLALRWRACGPVLLSSALCRWVRQQEGRRGNCRVVRLDNAEYARLLDRHEKAPRLALSPEDHERGRAELAALGIPPEAWFVCVHCREGGFLPHLSYHSYRDAAIANHLPAMRYVVERGGFAVRMGDPTMQPMAPEPGILDYAHSPAKSPFLDVYLSAACRLFLGSSSGLFIIAGLFGRPSAVANCAPMGSIPYRRGDLFIPKLVRRTADGGLLSFDEIMHGPASAYTMTEEFARDGLETVENSPEEILDLTAETLDTLDLPDQAPAHPLQDRFMAMFDQRHMGWGARSRIAASFVARRAGLFAPEARP